MTEIPTKLNLACGEDYRRGYWNVNEEAGVRVDQMIDLTEYPWELPEGHFDYILASHILEHLPDVGRALRECRRLLTRKGILEVRWPIGMNERADPDHKHEWTYRTPLFYCGERHWDVDVGLRVIERDIDLWSTQPHLLNELHSRKLDLKYKLFGPGLWCFAEPQTGGEFIVRFTHDGN